MCAPALSVVLPAWNEAARLPPFLERVESYLQARFPSAWEVIVVDDGSRDGTGEFLEKRAQPPSRIRVRTHPVCRGKGAAVRTGMLAASGQRLLFADADGATPIEEADSLLAALDGGADIAIGSRLAPAAGLRRRRNWRRRLAGAGFAWLARLWLGISARDTQCGFKMFDRRAARDLFQPLQETGYLFDLEVLARAQRAGYRVVEAPVNWSEVPGGHLCLLREACRIPAGLWRIRRRLRNLDPKSPDGPHTGTRK